MEQKYFFDTKYLKKSEKKNFIMLFWKKTLINKRLISLGQSSIISSNYTRAYSQLIRLSDDCPSHAPTRVICIMLNIHAKLIVIK